MARKFVSGSKPSVSTRKSRARHGRNPGGGTSSGGSTTTGQVAGTNTVFIDGQGFSVRQEDRAEFISDAVSRGGTITGGASPAEIRSAGQTQAVTGQNIAGKIQQQQRIEQQQRQEQINRQSRQSRQSRRDEQKTYLQQRQVDTFTPKGTRKQIPVTEVFVVNEAGEKVRKATWEEKKQFKEGTNVLQTREATPFDNPKLKNFLEPIKMNLETLKEVEIDISERTAKPLVAKSHIKDVINVGSIVAGTIPGSGATAEFGKGAALGIIEDFEQKPIQQLGIIGLGAAFTGAGVVAGTTARAAGVSKNVISLAGIGVGGTLGTIFLGERAERIVADPSITNIGKVVGVTTKDIVLFGVGTKPFKGFTKQVIIAREPKVRVDVSRDIIQRKVTETGEIKDVGSFVLKTTFKERKGVISTPQDIVAGNIRQVFSGKIAGTTKPEFLVQHGLADVVTIQPAKTVVKFAKKIEINEGVMMGETITTTKGSSVKLAKFLGETGKEKINVKTEFDSIQPIEKLLLQRVAEERIGKPVSQQNIPSVINKNLIIQRGGVTTREFATVFKSKKGIEGIDFYPRGGKLSDAQTLSVIEEVGTVAQRKLMEQNRIEVFKTTTGVKSIDTPFPRASGETPVISGFTVFKDIQSGGNIKTIIFGGKGTPKSIGLKTDLQLQQSVAALTTAKAGAAGTIQTPTSLSAAQVLKTTGATTQTSGLKIVQPSQTASQSKLDTKTVSITKTDSITKQQPKEITKTITRTVPKTITKTVSKTISKVLTKPLTKTVTKQVPKQISKTLQKQIPKTIQKGITKTPPGLFQVIPTTGKPPIIPGFKRVKKKKKRIPGLFGVAVKRGGKFKTIGSGLTLGKAIGVGSQRVGTTLAATFKIIPTQKGTISGGIRTPTGFRQKKGLTFVERRGLRLSTGGEVKAIQTARRIKT